MTPTQASIVARIPPRRTVVLLLTLALLVGGASRAGTQVGSGAEDKKAVPPPNGDWPCWRGSGSVGVRNARLAVTQWSENKGILWKAAVPGAGHASPIVFGD